MQEQRRRSSLGLNKNKVKIMEQVLSKFVSKQFLTAHSLFHNLFSSEQLSIDISSDQYLRMIFGVETLTEKQLYEFSYFHKRDKKVLLYSFLLHFLTKTAKFELVLMLNGEELQLQQLHQFLGESWSEFTKRIIIYHHSQVSQFIFNMQWLTQLKRERQFLKGFIICDVNSFESNDKSSVEKYYRKLPRDFFGISFRRDLFQYKLFQKSSLSYISQQQDLRQMNDKVTHYLQKKIDFFNYHCALIVPLQYVYANQCKTIEDSYKTVVLRSKGEDNRFEEIIFTSTPFHLEAAKQF